MDICLAKVCYHQSMSKRKRWIIGVVSSISVFIAIAAVWAWNATAAGDSFVRATLPEMTRAWDQNTLRANLSRIVFSDKDVAESPRSAIKSGVQSGDAQSGGRLLHFARSAERR